MSKLMEKHKKLKLRLHNFQRPKFGLNLDDKFQFKQKWEKKKQQHKKVTAEVKDLQKKLGHERREAFVLVLGPEGSGKTTLMKALQKYRKNHEEIDENNTIIHVRNPTVGFQAHHLKMVRFKFTIFDMSGKARYKSLCEEYYHQTHALIYVFDCGDLKHLSRSRDLLLEILRHPKMVNRKIPLLILANKEDLVDPQDIPDPEVYYDYLRLNQCLQRSRPHKLMFSSVFNCSAIRYGLSWMSDHLDVKSLEEPPCQCPTPYTDWKTKTPVQDFTQIKNVKLNYIARLMD